jgi:predicted amino acid dehydrogenase
MCELLQQHHLRRARRAEALAERREIERRWQFREDIGRNARHVFLPLCRTAAAAWTAAAAKGEEITPEGAGGGSVVLDVGIGMQPKDLRRLDKRQRLDRLRIPRRLLKENQARALFRILLRCKVDPVVGIAQRNVSNR